MTTVAITDFDVVFLSLDEPNADANWYDLLDKCPWAKRSHGVYGSDAAHKAAAKLCDTSRLITIDADNIVDPEFFNLEFDMSNIDRKDVISWGAKNEINGLVYGNGGIKCWPKNVIETMRTHEAAPENDHNAQVDFCWNINYVQMNNVYSHVHNNASPRQAWRAGFREGVKMTLENGNVVDRVNVKKVHRKNYQRLLVWQSVGADTLNGMWAMYGARLGTVMTNLRRETWDWRDVRDFKWLNKYWDEEVAPMFAPDEDQFINLQTCEHTGYTWDIDLLRDHTVSLGEELRRDLGLEVANLNKQECKFFKEVYTNPARVAPMAREEDVINGIE